MPPPGPKRLLVAALILGADWLAAEQHLPASNPDLFAVLETHQDSQLQHDTRFSNEPLDCMFYENAAVDHVISDGNGRPVLIFTSVRRDVAGYFLFPNILSLDSAGNWIRTPVPVTGDGWTHIHQSQDGSRILVAMDNVPESAGWETRFVLSEDAGASWRYVSEIHKYVYFDVIRFFQMTESGKGIAVEYYDGSVGGYDHAGYYIFRSEDWGRSWSEREYRCWPSVGSSSTIRMRIRLFLPCNQV